MLRARFPLDCPRFFEKAGGLILERPPAAGTSCCSSSRSRCRKPLGAAMGRPTAFFALLCRRRSPPDEARVLESGTEMLQNSSRPCEADRFLGARAPRIDCRISIPKHFPDIFAGLRSRYELSPLRHSCNSSFSSVFRNMLPLFAATSSIVSRTPSISVLPNETRCSKKIAIRSRLPIECEYGYKVAPAAPNGRPQLQSEQPVSVYRGKKPFSVPAVKIRCQRQTRRGIFARPGFGCGACFPIGGPEK